MPSAKALDAVTVDALGTLVELEDPVPNLRASLAERGVERDAAHVRAAFLTEAAYYLQRSHEGRDDDSLRDLRRRCAGVFLAAADADLDPREFAPAFMAAIGFHPLDGAVDALDRLRAAGLALACVTNWDAGFRDHLGALGLGDRFGAVVTSAEAGTPKPDRRIFELALARLGVEPGRALHVGDSDVDREGAAAAGLAFEPVPLATVPDRLGL
jgi:putative hydrolase of the HAD superfamily